MIKKRQEIVVILTLREINLHWVKMLNSRILYVVGVATMSWKLLQISEKLSFPSLIMKPISIF